MAERNTIAEAPRRMPFRIGINQGDVVVDDARVYGDGVNIAARLEAVADPGGICISDKVHQEIRGKIAAQFEDLGPQKLKNIAEPVRVYRNMANTEPTPASQSKAALALPDKPSIAVLPFTNFSGDPKEDYFSDGITEDIVTELSRFSELFVIAHNSSFRYKGNSPDIRQIGRELGVRYVLEGSVRRAGERVRITGQLIDAATGGHHWAERYDRELNDVFAIQDEVARTIVAILAVHVNKAEMDRSLLKPPNTWQAYDFYMRGTASLDAFRAHFRIDDLLLARRLFERSLEIDPNYARSYCGLSLSYLLHSLNPVDQNYYDGSLLDRGCELASHAAQLDPASQQAQSCLANALIWKGEHDQAFSAFKRAKQLNPNFADFRYSQLLVLAGEHEQAIQENTTLMRLDPFYPVFAPFWSGLANYMLEHYAEARALFRECVARAPNYHHGYLWLAATCMYLGRQEEAQHAAREVVRTYPAFTVANYTKFFVHLYKRPEDAERALHGLGMTGLS
jgi:adenylate cyclase